jgi:hypothetical protein
VAHDMNTQYPTLNLQSAAAERTENELENWKFRVRYWIFINPARGREINKSWQFKKYIFSQPCHFGVNTGQPSGVSVRRGGTPTWFTEYVLKKCQRKEEMEIVRVLHVLLH